MPWDSFRKKRAVASSPISKKKQQEQARKQIHQPQVDQNQPGNDTARSRPGTSIADSKDTGNHCASPKSPATSGLPKEIYNKITEVDKEPSTLTATGVEGLSARVQERHEYTQLTPDGIARTYTGQTVEIIKRPGQSLGLYLREGNGVDRADGVFVSRLVEGFDLQKSGVLSTGDEILTVNDVNVTKTSIDEVVVMVSIPRRLVLRTRTANGGFDPSAVPDGPGPSHSNTKPIAVLKQIPREESRESSLTDDGTPLVSSQLIATAHTSLGVKARQQEASAVHGGVTAASQGSAGHPSFAVIHHVQAPSTSASLPSSPPFFFDQHRSVFDRWSYNRQLAMHTPKVLDAQGQPLNEYPIGTHKNSNNGNNATNWQPRMVNHTDGNILSTSTDITCCGTPGPAVTSHAHRPPSSNDPKANPSSTAFLSSSTWRPPEPSQSMPQRSFSGYGMSKAGLRPVLRQSSSTFRTTTEPSVDTGNVKSNSLPRRQTGRTIKWRTDLPVARNMPSYRKGAMYGYSSDVSDSDGAVSAPEYPMSPTNRSVPQPVYPLPRQSGGMKTVDDIFSRAEYQAWTRSMAPSGSRGVGSVEGRHRYQYNTDASLQGRVIPGNQQWSGGQERLPFGDHQLPEQWQFINSQGTLMNHSDPRLIGSQAARLSNMAFIPYEHGWSQNRSNMDDSESSSSSTAYNSRQPQSARANHVSSTRSTSVPPKYTLIRSLSRPISGVAAGDQGSDQKGGVEKDFTGISTGGRYVLDVSPLPHRRLPLTLAAAYPGFGYTNGTPLDGFGGLYSKMDDSIIAALTGLLTVRIMEGRCLQCRDTDELYCVLEVDGEHRARTEVSDWQSGFEWRETFEIDVWDCRQADLYIYSWHPQYRHKLKYHATVQLIDTLSSMTKFDLNDDTSPSPSPKQPSNNQGIALNLNPHGQLLIQLGFRPMASLYRRTLATRRSAYFGMALQTLVERETGRDRGNNVPAPVVLRRLLEEIERRGVDASGLYLLCGSLEKKKAIKNALEREPSSADLTADTVPDTNILTTVVKDFLRELPEPLVPHATFQMLLEAWKSCLVNEKRRNARLMLGVFDCLPVPNKCTLMVLMDHSKRVISQSPYNGLSALKFSMIFGPIIFCTSQAFPISCGAGGGMNGSAFEPLKPYSSFLDHRLAARLLEVLLEYWPSCKGNLDNNAYSSLRLTNNGNRSLVELVQGGGSPESNC